MDEVIKSLEKSLLAFDKENIKRGLNIKEKRKKENLEYEIYWAKFKKFKADFETVVITDVKELWNGLKTPLLQKNIVIKNETHKLNSPRYIGPDLPIYIIITISDKSLSMKNRWERSPFILIKGNFEKDTIELFDCNQDLANVSDFIENNVFENPIVHFKIEEYKFNLLKPHIENWLNRNLDRIF